MSDLRSQATPRSIETLRGMAHKVKDALGYRDLATIPAGHLIEFALPAILPSFVYDVRSIGCMRENEGLAVPDHDYIAIREDVYEGALRGNGRDVFTLVHEFGHLVLHQSENLIHRRAAGTPPCFSQPEWQADTFAAELLMDHRLVANDDDDVAISRRFGVSISAARRRLRLLRQTGVLQNEFEPRRKTRPGSK